MSRLATCARVLAVVALGILDDAVASGRDHPWTRVGPFLPGGAVIALAIDSSSAETVYAAAEAGVFKTLDGGAHWTRSSSGLPLSSVLALVADPSSPSMLYAMSLFHGLFRSTNGGLTWEATADGVLPTDTALCLMVDPAGVLYAGIFGVGVLMSLDRGQTWTNQSRGLDSLFVASIAGAPSVPSTLYAATDTGIFRTTNGGGLWTRTSSLQVSALVVDPRTSAVVYGLSSLGVSKSVDAGATWLAKNSGLPVGATAVALSVDAVSSMILYLTTTTSIFKSTDGGETWVDRSAGVVTPDLCPGAIAIAPNAPHSLYLGNQCAGGVFRSLDAATSWTRTEDDFSLPRISALLSDAVSPAVFAATDHGIFQTTSLGASWTALNSGLSDVDMVSLAQAPSNSATLYAGTSSGKLYRTGDGGLTWVATALAPQSYASPLVVAPGSQATVYVAQYDTLVKSSDAGQTWNAVRTFDAAVSTLVFGGANLYLGTSGGEIWTTGDGGGTWQRLHAFDLYQSISAILIDPRSPSILYTSWIFSGAAPPELDPNGGVFKSTDGGSSWQSVEDGLGVTSLVMSPENPSVLRAGIIRGQLIESLDAGASWQSVGDGLPDGFVAALTINPLTSSTLYAGMSTNFEANGVFALGSNDRGLHRVSGPNRSTRVVTRPD